MKKMVNRPVGLMHTKEDIINLWVNDLISREEMLSSVYPMNHKDILRTIEDMTWRMNNG